MFASVAFIFATSSFRRSRILCQSARASDISFMIEETSLILPPHRLPTQIEKDKRGINFKFRHSGHFGELFLISNPFPKFLSRHFLHWLAPLSRFLR